MSPVSIGGGYQNPPEKKDVKRMFPIYTEKCPDNVLEMIIQVKPEQTDRRGRMRLGDLARQMQILTEEHFDRFSGLTIDQLNEKDLSWIIAWSELQIERLPAAGEQIRMRVWAGKKKAVLHTRKYAFYTMDGHPLITTSSLFILMDRNTRQAAADPEQLKSAAVVQLQDEPKAPKMSIQFPDAYANRKERIVSPEEIDYNGHLNNSHYLDWTEELPEDSYLETHVPKMVWIEYSKELKEGQKAEMSYEIRNDLMYVRGLHDGSPSFRVKIEYDVDAS